jgi:hypothetical protein
MVNDRHIIHFVPNLFMIYTSSISSKFSRLLQRDLFYLFINFLFLTKLNSSSSYTILNLEILLNSFYNFADLIDYFLHNMK